MIQEIKKWCDKNNALNRTIEFFWNSFEEYKNEDFGEFSEVFPKGKDDVNIKFDKIAYEIDLPNYLQELITVTTDIYVAGKKVGWYKQMYMLDGEPFDEYFVIE